MWDAGGVLRQLVDFKVVTCKTKTTVGDTVGLAINQIVELHRTPVGSALDRQGRYPRDTHLLHEEGHPDKLYKRGQFFLIKVSPL